MLQRDNADDDCWVGLWRLMVSYKARRLDAMLMPTIGAWMVPVAAGPARGPRYSRLLVQPKQRIAPRNIVQKARHALDVLPPSTNNNGGEACDVVINIYARSRLQVELTPKQPHVDKGAEIEFILNLDVLQGTVQQTHGLGRLVAPAHDLSNVLKNLGPNEAPPNTVLEGSKALKYDPALVLAEREKRHHEMAQTRDEQLAVVIHEKGPLHAHIQKTEIPGVYHVSVYVEGDYCPGSGTMSTMGHDHGAMAPMPAPKDPKTDCVPQRFTRLLTSLAVVLPKK
jgi:hypothetical protein